MPSFIELTHRFRLHKHTGTDGSAAISTAPTTADYLVGTAQSDLSAEIVVGTTPGGELGGTWAAPTVDATHSGSAHPTIVRKTADEPVASSTVLQNDDHLFFAVAANETWIFELVAFVRGEPAADMIIAFTWPAGATVKWGDVNGIHRDSSPGDTTADALSAYALTISGDPKILGTINGPTGMIVIRGIIVNGATAGNLQFRWAQGTSNVTATTVQANSHLIAHRVG